VYYNDFITDNMKLMKATATPIEIRRFTLHPGDVVITKDSEAWDDIAVPACVSEPLDNVLCGYHLSIFRPHPTMLDGRFLLRTIQANGVREQFWVEARGVTRFGLGQDGMKDALLPLPPIPTQKSIANYLDHKTAAIDSLIEKKRRLLDLLAEERAALINQAVTKGLDPDVPMKDSGIPWIGKVPAHWEVLAIRRFVRRIEQGWSPLCENRLAEPGEWGVLKVGCVNGGFFRSGEHKALPAEFRPVPKLEVRDGDLLMSRANTSELVGSTAVVIDPQPHLLLCDKLYRIHLYQRRCRMHYFSFMMASSALRAQFEAISSGASGSMQNIGQERLREFIVALAPVDEQALIENALATSNSESLIVEGKLLDQIGRLQEYRQSLITAAVTGQLDIEEAA
jgi:type I restriction enzyme S subunit